MQILSLNFLLYTISGIWRPIKWSSKYSKLLYGILTTLSVYLMIFLMVTHLMDIILIVDNMEDFTTNSLMFISIISMLFKTSAVLTRRSDILNVIKILEKKPCKPCNEKETDIQMKFDRLIRSHSISYIILSTFSVMGAVAGGVLLILEGQLPYRVWVPWDCSSLFLFWFTSIQEIIAVILGTIVNVATETTVLGLCLQICSQFELLEHRLQKVVEPNNEKKKTSKDPLNDASNKSGRLSEHISHHLCIIRLAEMINNIFSQVIFVQFFASILVLCSSLYHLTSHMTITDIATLIVYTLCMFVQIFVYCWAGNEVMLKSTGLSEAVYQMNWILMTISERRDLLMIMKRSTRPIKFTSSFLVTLSLTSYGNLLKASYSAFNVLQQS